MQNSDEISKESVRKAFAFLEASREVMEDEQARRIIDKHMQDATLEETKEVLKSYSEFLLSDRTALYLMLASKWGKLMDSPLETLIDLPLFLGAVLLRATLLALWPLYALYLVGEKGIRWAGVSFQRQMRVLAIPVAILGLASYASSFLNLPSWMSAPKFHFPPTLSDIVLLLYALAVFYIVLLLPLSVVHRVRQGTTFASAMIATLKAPFASFASFKRAVLITASILSVGFLLPLLVITLQKRDYRGVLLTLSIEGILVAYTLLVLIVEKRTKKRNSTTHKGK